MSPEARRAGLQVGMPEAEARALLPGVVLLPHAPADDAAELERLADQLLRFSPAVAVELPDGLAADITGCEHLFGGEAGLLARAAAALSGAGYEVGAGVADTLGAAWAIARSAAGRRPGGCVIPAGGEADALAPLPIELLRLPADAAERLRRVGIDTVGRLAALPRAALSSRFGAEVLLRLDQAAGVQAEPLHPRRPVPQREVRREFEDAIEHRAVLRAAVGEMLAELTAALARRDEGVRELECLFFPGRGPPQIAALSLVEPSCSAGYVGGLLAARLEPLNWPGPVAAVALRAMRTERLVRRQGDWLIGGDGRGEAFRRLVDRLSAELGPAAVARAELLEDHQPELAFALRPWAGPPPPPREEADPGPFLIPDDAAAPIPFKPPPGGGNSVPPRPLRLLAPAEPIEVTAAFPDGPPAQFVRGGRAFRVTAAVGPERIETGWWRGSDIRRDYYRIEAEDGARLWIYRNRHNGRWYLHGSFE